ncbi:PREDICTED: far upstream element-binding protein 3 [Rhagoletis zephyria]|uniref:far upstream element-binding protein 3 n=1 Tax=Rhagoletis zephyria TaxID=28612 RepID=UPI000811314C|nr:PREDICTED: far upstream element-binding protein 3 [Rhagoletis zephyria]XP_036333486.1 far upstream element-binding protein 3 [Rhagoletis pomonella]XP_036333487.1 far upstream element-binding protein 3 [Rhagoletis pomonella]
MSEFPGAQSNLNQSQAFAAALQRAKQIAAKIQPNAAQGNGGVPNAGPSPTAGVGFKRSHDDSDSGPEMKRFTSPGNDYNNSNGSSVGGGGGSIAGSGNISQALAQAAAVAQRLAATAGTTVEEQIRIPEPLVNAVLGRGSTETITQIQAESGCKVQLSQDQDRVVTLRGSRETVTKGRELFQQLSNRNGGGNIEVVLTINMPPPGPTGFPPYQEIMIPGTKVGLVIGKGGDTIKQLQEKTGAKMVIIQDGPNQEIIKPLRISGDPQKIEHAKQSVLDLIAQKDLQAAALAARNNGGSVQGTGGGGSSGGYNFGNLGEQCEVFVPKIAVGVVIGKGGDMIRKIQTECGCKLQFIQGKNDEPGDRRCLIQGTRQQVDDAKRMIDGLIENMMQRQQRNASSSSNGNTEGNNSNYGYGYGVNHAQQPPREEITFMVPSSKCGIVIGRGGETIKLINQQSGAYCEMDRNAVNPPSEKLFKCKGTSEQVEAARQMIAEKINMELPIIARKPISGNIPGQHNNQGGGYGQNPMQNDPNAAAAAYQQQWGGYAQGWGDQSQQQQMMMGGGAMGQNVAAAAGGGQQADYSAQWIEYYKSMGMMREAEMIEQQLKAKQAGANAGQPMAVPQQQQAQPPQQQQQPQPQQQQQQGQGGGSADYSAQWAEYYRSIGKIAEAEAIEKQMKQGQSGQPNAAGAAGGNSNAPAGSNSSSGNNSGAGAANNPADGGSNAALQGMTPSQYAQYSQYYAAAAAQASQAAGGAAPGYPQQAAYGGYGAPGGGYPGAPQPNMTPGPNASNPKQNKSDKN